MNILIVGSGGREHALAWKCSQSPLADTVWVAPGNAGTAGEDGVSNVDISVNDTESLLEFARSQAIALTIIGPEVPLVNGVVNRFQEAGLAVFGPEQAAAELEGSKAFTKAFLQRHNIPTASYAVFTDCDEALSHLHNVALPIVIKADGLAAGKGVIVAQSMGEAEAAIRHNLDVPEVAAESDSPRIVIEEFMRGEEASFICMVAGDQVIPLATSQDHKARDNGDLGPNTGGMGAYSPAPVVTAAVHEHVMKDIIYPTVHGLIKEQRPFTGFLYAGLMIDEQGKARVVEYNVRLGDPETQPLMMRLQTDLVALCCATLHAANVPAAALPNPLGEDLEAIEIEWSEGAAVGVVLAAEGYPGSYSKGDPIDGISAAENEHCKVFHAGTALSSTQGQPASVTTNGGRVLCVVGEGKSVAAAQSAAYAGVDSISWKGMFFRNDIADKAL